MIALKVWATTLLTALAAVVAAFGWGRWKGARRMRDETRARVNDAERQVRVAERTQADSETRFEVDTDVLQLPTGIPSPVAVAVPDSAADRLYDDWSRDGNNDGLRVDTADSGVSTGSTHGSDSTTNSGP